MTNLDPKKTNAPETTELNDAELDQVAGGAISVKDYTEHRHYCGKCGARIVGVSCATSAYCSACERWIPGNMVICQ